MVKPEKNTAYRKTWKFKGIPGRVDSSLKQINSYSDFRLGRMARTRGFLFLCGASLLVV